MKNKVKLKKFLLRIFLFSIVLFLILFIVKLREYSTYTKNFNIRISSIVDAVEDKYPEVTENEIMEILNSKDEKSSTLKKYNIDLEKDSVIKQNDIDFYKFLFLNSTFLLFTILSLTLIFLKFNKNKDKEIDEITKYIEEINKKNYKLNIDDISEDELSILKNEIYKTTIMLKEQAENLSKDKLELKTSLSDISHQLKTPLTSIMIILDNLIEEEDMDRKTRQEFIFDIKREINNINFLIQSLLKLSKLDTNTVKYNNENVSVKEIIDESIKKLAMLCELKNVHIDVFEDDKASINADKNWQVEAISNILKNCIEYSKNDSEINIHIKDTKVYAEIEIIDHGIGIDPNDLPHIFERFYRGKNVSPDSIGIGLALAKKIIEQSNGKINVESKIGEGTKFTIRYYK